MKLTHGFAPSHRRRERHNGNNNDYELTHAVETTWKIHGRNVKELHRMVWPLLISKFRLSYVHWYTDPETRARLIEFLAPDAIDDRLPSLYRWS
jgi:hypothetical protein